MTKAAVIKMALECFVRRANLHNSIRFKCKFSNLEVAFTKDVPEDIKRDIYSLFNEIVLSIGEEDKYGKIKLIESPMSVVSRDKSLWDK